MREAAIALMAAAPLAAPAQDSRSATVEAVTCGGAALALRLLREREVEDGYASAEPQAEDARRAHLAIGLQAARATGCGMNQITYEVGTTLAAHERLRAVRRAAPDGVGFARETRRVADEVQTCLADRGGSDLYALIEPRDDRGLIEPCGWRE